MELGGTSGLEMEMVVPHLYHSPVVGVQQQW